MGTKENNQLTESESGAKVLLDSLKKQGVDVIFGYPGGAVLPLYDALYSHELSHILARHEQGAVHMAEGYAKATGKPGVVVVTSGPGATNVITGIADALGDSVPIVVITGQVHTDGIGKDAFQEADMMGITMPITKYNYQIRDVKDIPATVQEAFHLATTGRPGPVVIDLPKNMTVVEKKVNMNPVLDIPSYQPTVKPNQLQVKKLLEALRVAKKPLVLAGAGVGEADATQELLAFVERYQIPVVTSLLGLGDVPNAHPLFLGMGGMHGSFASNMALTDCDLLISIGCRFSDRMATNAKKFAPNAIVAHIDIDPAEIGKIIPTKIPIVGDAKVTLQEILAEETVKVSTGDWVKLNQSRKRLHPFTFDRTQHAEIKPQKVIELIGKWTHGDAIVATDVGQHQMWTAQYYPFNHGKQIITSGSLGTMGYGIPAGIGAKVGQPNKEVVVFVGDGGFQMTNQELAILNDHGLDLKVIILNNSSLGMVRQWQETFYGNRRSESVFTSQPDFVKMAEAYHINGFRIDNPETFEKDLEKAFKSKGPAVIEVVVSPTEHVLPMVPSGKANSEMLGVE